MAFSRRMRALPLPDVDIVDPFWTRWQRVVAEDGLISQFEKLESTDRLGNLRRCVGPDLGTHTGLYFNDSDVYKWLEAAAYALVRFPNDALKRAVETCIGVILEAQSESGYINSFIQLNHTEMEFRNLGAIHEMYCAGHMMECGVALFECLGDRRILDASARLADHLMHIFGPGKRVGYCGHEELEIGLIRLARATRNDSYREFARWMIEQRGNRPSPLAQELEDPESQKLLPGHRHMVTANGEYSGEYCQDHLPIREQHVVVGHAVRAMYLYTAAADLATDLPDPDLESALEASWQNLTRKRMYITAGIGPSMRNEGFTADYDLPNLTAYAETCAACGLIFWAQAMLEATGSSEYADVIERALYNGALSGISLDGRKYFYDNPLESRGQHQRTPWFHCACCPPNIARLIENLASYAIGISDASVYIHQFVGLKATFHIGGTPVLLEIESKFPWNGDVTVRVRTEKPVAFALNVRIPDWADDVSTDHSGDEEAEYLDGYAVIDRVWNPDDELKLTFEMTPIWIESNPKVKDNLGRLALIRGPLVYCGESVDNGYSPQAFSVDVEAEISEEWSEDLEGHMKVTAVGYQLIEEDSEDLYVPFGTAQEEDGELKMIPYYAWANRGPADMQVWLRT